jgi:hypothetical protein
MGRKTRKHTRKNRKHNHTKMCGDKCSHCGPNCFCGPNCSCPKGCPGNCYMNKKMHKKGGSGCGPYGCPLAPLSWNKMQEQMGGAPLPDCVTGCGPILGIAQNGGSEGFFKPPAPVPGPFVGEPTSGFVSTWPSVDGVSGNRNYYDMNLYKSDPQTMMKVGGKSRRKPRSRKQSRRRGHKRSQRGGLTSLAPQELVNLGRELSFNYQSAYNSLNGIPAPVSPDPWKGQLQPSTK